MLTTDIVYRILNQVLDEAKHDGGAPISVAVCDRDGSLAGFLKMDGAAARTGHLARHKAYTAARMQARTTDFLTRIKRENVDISYYCDPDLTPLPGGAPLVNKEGNIIGSVGISGRPSEQDQAMVDDVAARILRVFMQPVN
jgi:uncharacterized protein GlcG (DUF336 family)